MASQTAGLVWIYNPCLRSGPAGPELRMLPRAKGRKGSNRPPTSGLPLAGLVRVDLLSCG